MVVGLTIPCERALAGMVSLSPLRVHFDASQQSGVVQVQNIGEHAISMQVEAREWSQSEDGTDQYESTSDVLAVPPIFSIEPGETQLVRVGMLADQSTEKELTYRLFLTELPQPLDDSRRRQLRMRLRISMPVFTAPAVVSNPTLELVGAAVEEQGLRATFRNTGNTHVRVEELTAVRGDGQEAERQEKAVYLLAGTQRDFLFDSASGESISRLIAVTDTVGTREYEVVTP